MKYEHVIEFVDCKDYFKAYTAREMASSLRKFSPEKFSGLAKYCEDNADDFEHAGSSALAYILYGCGIEG